MSLAERAANFTARSLSSCRTCAWYDKLPDEDKQAFEQLANRDDLYRADFLDMCREEGLQCSETAFRRHMKCCHGTR